MLFGPCGEGIFLWEVEVRVEDTGVVFNHREFSRAKMKSVVLSSSLEEEAFGNYVGQGERFEEI